jgi:tetratricopeptide (TPR) repeat protein
MSSALTVGERIILHLGQYSKLQDSYDVPLDVSQDGIAGGLRISRAHAAIELKKLKEAGTVVERLAHIKRGKTKRKVYFLTHEGEGQAAKIREYARTEGIDVAPLLDLRRCRGPDLYSSTPAEFRPVLAGACVFRVPFARSALPETCAAILPVDREGMVNMPEELKATIPGIIGKEELRRHHSLAADYMLAVGDYRERLYHLLNAGRAKEAEMLIASHGASLLASPDEDTLDLVSMIEAPSARYGSRVRKVQAEAARAVGDADYCLQIASAMQASTDPKERFEGLFIRGRVLCDGIDVEKGMAALQEARIMALPQDRLRTDLEIARALVSTTQWNEATPYLDNLLHNEVMNDPDQIELAYYLEGVLLTNRGNAPEAIKYLSKSLAIAKTSDKIKWYRALADAYGRAGLTEKAIEYELKANPPKKWGEA